jgi:hypothetical protein
MSDAILHESNRAAHRVAKEARLLCGWLDTLETEQIVMLPIGLLGAHERTHKALAPYEEIERKAQREATA